MVAEVSTLWGTIPFAQQPIHHLPWLYHSFAGWPVMSASRGLPNFIVQLHHLPAIPTTPHYLSSQPPKPVPVSIHPVDVIH